MSKDLLRMSKTKFFILMVFLCTCLSTNTTWATGHKSSSYKKQLKNWTREDEVYQREDFHASFKWHATRLSDEFLEAWANEQAKIYDLDDEAKVRFLQNLQNEYANQDVFFVSFYSYSFRESDLSNPKAVWKLSLETADSILVPVQIQKLPKPTSYHSRIFKYIDTWSTCYFVTFPKSQNGDQDFHLKINGPTGKGQLQWKAR